MPALEPQPQPASPPAPEPKWWAHSLTIWGALITAIATVLPALAPLLGLNLPPEVARQLGQDLIQLGQAVAGLAGTVLTIYGRVRASAPLERRQLSVNL